MRLVDVLRCLRLNDVQLAGQAQEVVVEQRVRHDLDELLGLGGAVRQLQEDLLASQHEGELLLHGDVGAGREDLLDDGSGVDLLVEG